MPAPDDSLHRMAVADDNARIFAEGGYTTPDGRAVALRAALDAAVASTTLLTEWTLALLTELKPAPVPARVPAVFAAAHAAGCDGLVVGPWGCGAFRNDPRLVAGAFARALRQWEAAFRLIVFSTFGPEENARAFDRELGLWVRP
jgi:hypothetical protein